MASTKIGGVENFFMVVSNKGILYLVRLRLSLPVEFNKHIAFLQTVNKCPMRANHHEAMF